MRKGRNFLHFSFEGFFHQSGVKSEGFCLPSLTGLACWRILWVVLCFTPLHTHSTHPLFFGFHFSPTLFRGHPYTTWSDFRKFWTTFPHRVQTWSFGQTPLETTWSILDSPSPNPEIWISRFPYLNWLLSFSSIFSILNRSLLFNVSGVEYPPRKPAPSANANSNSIVAPPINI